MQPCYCWPESGITKGTVRMRCIHDRQSSGARLLAARVSCQHVPVDAKPQRKCGKGTERGQIYFLWLMGLRNK